MRDNPQAKADASASSATIQVLLPRGCIKEAQLANSCLVDATFVVLVLSMRSRDLHFTAHVNDQIGQVTSVSKVTLRELHLPPDQGFRPVWMEVHDNVNARGEMPVRICLLGANGIVLRTFTMSK